MERLTEIVRNEVYLKKSKSGCGEICSETVECKDCVLREALVRLAAYENTNLTPDQIVELDRLYREKCEEVEKLKEQLEAKESS